MPPPPHGPPPRRWCASPRGPPVHLGACRSLARQEVRDQPEPGHSTTAGSAVGGTPLWAGVDTGWRPATTHLAQHLAHRPQLVQPRWLQPHRLQHPQGRCGPRRSSRQHPLDPIRVEGSVSQLRTQLPSARVGNVQQQLHRGRHRAALARTALGRLADTPAAGVATGASLVGFTAPHKFPSRA